MKILTLLSFSLIALTQASAFAGTPLSFGCRIDKWTELDVNVDATGATTVNYVQGNRERTGEGAYTQDVFTILNSFAADSNNVTQNADGSTLLTSTFTGDGGQSTLSILITPVPGGPAGAISQVSFSGTGPQYVATLSDWTSKTKTPVSCQ